MIRLNLFSLLTVGLLTSLSSGAETAEEQAKAAVAVFIKAVKARDVDGVMKIADVPWFTDEKKLIKNRDDLKAYVSKKLEGLKDPDQIPVNIRRVQTWEKFDQKKKLDADEQKLVNEALGKNGLIVVVGRGDEDAGFLLIRVDAGKAKVVGVAN
jgi:hypothetical protein